MPAVRCVNCGSIVFCGLYTSIFLTRAHKSFFIEIDYCCLNRTVVQVPEIRGKLVYAHHRFIYLNERCGNEVSRVQIISRWKTHYYHDSKPNIFEGSLLACCYNGTVLVTKIYVALKIIYETWIGGVGIVNVW